MERRSGCCDCQRNPARWRIDKMEEETADQERAKKKNEMLINPPSINPLLFIRL